MLPTIYTASRPFLLAAGGYRGVIFDLDNTVAPYERLRPDEATMNYFAAIGKSRHTDRSRVQ